MVKLRPIFIDGNFHFPPNLGEFLLIDDVLKVWDGKNWLNLSKWPTAEKEEILVENVCNFELPDELFKL